MRIKRLNLFHLALPFKGEFSISIRKGYQSRIVVLEVIGENDAFRGYGEGVPVFSVTGETPESVIQSIRQFAVDPLFPWDLEEVSQISRFVDQFPDEKYHNAAICAVETGLLDLLGKVQKCSVSEFFDQSFLTDRIWYGAPVPLGDAQRISVFCRQIKALGIRRVRIKMGAFHEQNRRTLETVSSQLGRDCQLRIDPNGAWDRGLAFRHLPLIQEHGVNIVEEPMKRDAPGFSQFAEALREKGILLMACESAPTLKDIQGIIDEKLYQMINIKLCRSGGFQRAIRMIECVRESPLSFQIGCTLGESGILSAAGRALCLLSKDAANWDGSYDRFLLQANTTTQDIGFGPGGAAGPLEGHGLGIRVDTENLKRLAISPVISIERP